MKLLESTECKCLNESLNMLLKESVDSENQSLDMVSLQKEEDNEPD